MVRQKQSPPKKYSIKSKHMTESHKKFHLGLLYSVKLCFGATSELHFSLYDLSAFPYGTQESRWDLQVAYCIKKGLSAGFSITSA